MIRLIDKMQLVDTVLKKRYSQASINLILNQPEIKAIPMAWISKYSRGPLTNEEYWTIIRMVTAWEEENETN